MMTRLALSLALLAALPAHAQLSQFGWFADLAGSCWRGEPRSDGRSDEQCYSSQFGKFMRGTIRFYQADRLTGEGDSVFSFDPNARLIVYTQWASNGSFGFGEASLEGDELVFHNRLADGNEAPARSVWRRGSTPDAFVVSRQRRDDRGDWKEEGSITYKRTRPAMPRGAPPKG
jgi:hypothetical protein